MSKKCAVYVLEKEVLVTFNMGSVKDLIVDGPIGERFYRPPTATDFGEGAWRVKGTYSVRDLKRLIPDVDIVHKPACLAMSNAAFFEFLSKEHPDIEHCYLGLIDSEGNVTDVRTLLDRGETSNLVLMKLAHTPESFSNGDLNAYRSALQSGELQCGVADVESIFRAGFPLGSSTFKRIFAAVGRASEYETLATYEQVSKSLDQIRMLVEERGLGSYPELEKILRDSGLGTRIPNPGFVLREMVFDSTTKFESAGDRVINRDEERKLSGLNQEGYSLWTSKVFPNMSRAQVELARQRDILLYDGKGESVAFRGKPAITDFAFTPDENRMTVLYKGPDGVTWALPTNKEYQRARFTEAGVDIAIGRAKTLAREAGNTDGWRDYLGPLFKDMGIDLRALSDDTLQTMSYALGEVGNRVLGRRVFDVPVLDTWADRMLPYASKVEYQEVPDDG